LHFSQATREWKLAFFSIPCYNIFMKKNNVDQTIFKIKFTKLIIALSIAVFALCIVGVGLSVWRIYRFGIHGFTDVIKYPFLIAVCVFCIVLMICVLAKSQYVVSGNELITQYGFIKSKFPVKDISSLTLDIQTQKLTVSFGEQFMVMSVNPDWQEKLVRALLAINPDIEYSFTLSDAPDTQENNSKKDE